MVLDTGPTVNAKPAITLAGRLPLRQIRGTHRRARPRHRPDEPTISATRPDVGAGPRQRRVRTRWTWGALRAIARPRRLRTGRICGHPHLRRSSITLRPSSHIMSRSARTDAHGRSTRTDAHIGGYRVLAVTSEHHVARLVFQCVSEPCRLRAAWLSGADSARRACRPPNRAASHHRPSPFITDQQFRALISAGESRRERL